MWPLDIKFDIKTLKSKIKGEWSRIYGFILYTRKDAFVRRVLNDQFFNDALNDVSGCNWPIFYIDPYLNYDSESIFDYFDLDSREAPCFVTFIWGDDNQLRSFVISIDGSTDDEVYHSLLEIVSSITDAENQILEKYKSTENVFREVRNNLEGLKFKHKVHEFADKAKLFMEFFSKFK